jgi:hypothetical protein
VSLGGAWAVAAGLDVGDDGAVLSIAAGAHDLQAIVAPPDARDQGDLGGRVVGHLEGLLVDVDLALLPVRGRQGLAAARGLAQGAGVVDVTRGQPGAAVVEDVREELPAVAGALIDPPVERQLRLSARRDHALGLELVAEQPDLVLEVGIELVRNRRGGVEHVGREPGAAV